MTRGPLVEVFPSNQTPSYRLVGQRSKLKKTLTLLHLIHQLHTSIPLFRYGHF